MSQCLRTLRDWIFFFLIMMGAAARAEWPATGVSGAARPKPVVATDTCTDSGCHDSLLRHKVLHGPVAAQKCLDCHKYQEPAEHKFTSISAPNQECTRCHDMKLKSVVHAPVQHGNCMSCHDPHGSDYPNSLRTDPAKVLCQTCHTQGRDAGRAFVHTVLANGPCSTCHETHSAENPHLLKQPVQSLCISCHKQSVPVPGEAMSTHAPAKENCLACHDPHASKLKNELKQDAPGLCLSCHRNLKDALAAAPVVHGAIAQDRSCLGCHVPHFSKLPRLQKESQPKECLSCHDRTLPASDGRMITNMGALLETNPEHHGPIRLGACTACHQPHAANNPKLLALAYPPEFYAPFQVERYQLCFTCHTKDLVLVPDATAPTGFKNGEKNLHWLHVDQEKGRTCRACHEVHASKQPFHIRESVPFGPSGWSITIKYRQTANGGTCEAGCHGEKSYDHGVRPRSIPVVALTPKAQALLNPPGPTSGPTTAPAVVAALAGRSSFPVPSPPFTPGVFPCTACHDPSLAVNTQRRTLHKPHEDIQLHHDEEHRWCLDCHNAQNRDVLRSASGEPIPFAESYRLCGQCHGTQYRDWKSGVHGKRTGEWNGRKDYLLCVHCHNPHSPKFKPIKPLPPPFRPSVAKDAPSTAPTEVR